MQAVAALLSEPASSFGALRPILAEVQRRLQRVRRDIYPIDGARAGGAALMGYPAFTGGLRLFFIRDGQLLARETVRCGSEVGAVAARLLSLAPREYPSDALDALDADQTNILLRWLHRNLGQPEVVALPDGAGPETVAAAIEEQLTQAQPFEEADVEAEVMDAGEALGRDVLDFEEVS
jgi:hypothetical protein